jgi:hypothetical protein
MKNVPMITDRDLYPWCKAQWISGMLALALMLMCIGLVWHWPIVKSVTRSITIEIDCWRAESRSGCLRQRHQEAEALSLKAIEDELLDLNPTRPCGAKRAAAGQPDCPGGNRMSSDEP